MYSNSHVSMSFLVNTETFSGKLHLPLECRPSFSQDT